MWDRKEGANKSAGWAQSTHDAKGSLLFGNNFESHTGLGCSRDTSYLCSGITNRRANPQLNDLQGSSFLHTHHFPRFNDQHLSFLGFDLVAR